MYIIVNVDQVIIISRLLQFAIYEYLYQLQFVIKCASEMCFLKPIGCGNMQFVFSLGIIKESTFVVPFSKITPTYD